ncbi:MAG TPA: serine/threonine-protein kinase, partial [Candidatus Xenobia bacterium]
MLAIGTVLQQKYRIENVLGRGGMGDVYLAHASHLKDQVAVKEVHPPMGKPDIQEAALQQFRQEAGLLRGLKHRMLPRVYDYFELDGVAYMVMEYIKGRSLDAVMMAEDEPLPIPMVMGWAADLCDVLDYLHTHDPVVVYRDLKPSNIMLDVNGKIKLIDFGISKTFDKANPALTSTFARGAISPGFTAPEQYSGGTDPRTDLYSLGATLYALLTRTPPPSAVERAADIVSLVPLRTFRPEVSDQVAAAIEQLMKVRASDRHDSIEEVRTALGLPTRRARATSELTEEELPAAEERAAEPEEQWTREESPPTPIQASPQPRRPKSAPR